MNRRIDLDAPRTGDRGAGVQMRGSWLIAPLLLSAVGAGTLFVFRGPDHLFGIAFGLVLGLGFLWILVSTMFPSKPDRTCPSCGGETLERLDATSTRGVTCSACSWNDETLSSFYMAEEEDEPGDFLLPGPPAEGPGAPPRRW